MSRDQTSALVGVLRDLEKVLTGDDSPLSAQYVKAKAWVRGRKRMSTEELRKEFGKRLGLKILLDPTQLKKSIQNGCGQGVWVYHDAKRDRIHGKGSAAPLVEISEDAMLYTPEAARRMFPDSRSGEKEEPRPPESCPLCGEVECRCGEDLEPDTAKLLVVTENGAPGRVFQRIADRFHDAGRELVGELVITCEGLPDMQALGIAVPQFPKGEYRLRHDLTAEFDDPAAGESLSVEFTGGWTRYKRLRSVLETQAREATKVAVTNVLTAIYPDGLSPASRGYQTLRDVLVQLDMGRIEVQASEHRGVDQRLPLG